jgi:multimeric flavodoxin WrbA
LLGNRYRRIRPARLFLFSSPIIISNNTRMKSLFDRRVKVSWGNGKSLTVKGRNVFLRPHYLINNKKGKEEK